MSSDRAEWVADLSNTYGRMVFATAFRILGNAEDAEDVLQEVFLKLLGSWRGRWKPDSVRDWGAYLRVAASRCAVDLLRRKPKWGQECWEFVQDVEAPAENNPRFLASQNQKARLLRHALSRLPERDARVFALRYLEDFPYEAIAEQMNLSVNQVGVILHRARGQLREILQAEGESARDGRGVREAPENQERKETSHVKS
ncbi:MAG TPA: sigma-70 family RNA polymerase sigma factor [bacterium]|nr:sigma-70 family RNA polymerase sigma factor [bacterium]